MQSPQIPHRRIATRARIFAACEQLGEDVSTRNVRQIIGGGSLRDIGEHVRAWRAVVDGAAVRDASNVDRVAGSTSEALQAIASCIYATLDEQSHLLERQRRAWRDDLLEVRGQLSQLTTLVQRPQAQSKPSVDAATPLERKLGQSEDAALREAVSSTNRRLDTLDSTLRAQCKPQAVNRSSTIEAQLDDLAGQVGHLADFIGNRQDPASAAAAVIGRGEIEHEALAETFGHCLQQSVKEILDALSDSPRRAHAKKKTCERSQVLE